jgi:hypothetical protein
MPYLHSFSSYRGEAPLYVEWDRGSSMKKEPDGIINSATPKIEGDP